MIYTCYIYSKIKEKLKGSKGRHNSALSLKNKVDHLMVTIKVEYDNHEVAKSCHIDGRGNLIDFFSFVQPYLFWEVVCICDINK